MPKFSMISKRRAEGSSWRRVFRTRRGKAFYKKRFRRNAKQLAIAAIRLARRLAPQLKELVWIGDATSTGEPLPTTNQHYQFSLLFDIPMYTGLTTGVGLTSNGTTSNLIPMCRFTNIGQGPAEHQRIGIDIVTTAVEGEIMFYYHYRMPNDVVTGLSEGTQIAPTAGWRYQERRVRIMIVGEWDSVEEVTAKQKPLSLPDLLESAGSIPLGSDYPNSFRNQNSAMFSGYKPMEMFGAGGNQAKDQRWIRQRKFHIYYDRVVKLKWDVVRDGGISADFAAASTLENLAQTRCKKKLVHFRVPMRHHSKYLHNDITAIESVKGNLYLYVFQDSTIEGSNSPGWWTFDSATPVENGIIMAAQSARVRSWIADK